MKICKRKGTVLAVAGSLLALSAPALAAPATPEMLAHACAGCHGTLGGSAGPTMPSLASQTKEAIVDAMGKFKSGERPSTIMGRIAKGYSDEQIDALGSFFAKQKRHATHQTVDKKKVAQGAKLQNNKCARCHDNEGKSSDDETPVLASQWLPYLRMQMELYDTEARKMPKKMADKMRSLSKEDVDALLNFYASRN